MRTRFVIFTALLASIIFVASVNTAQAQWPAITHSNYAITTNYHGKEVPLGESVTATAGTRDSTVTTIEFKWLTPVENVFATSIVPVSGPLVSPAVPPGATEEIINWANKYPGITYWYAQDTQTPNTLGDWAVKAIFHNGFGHTMASLQDSFPVRATSFNVVPEVPLGTIVILLSMFGALGVFAVKKRRMIAPGRPT